MSGNEAALPPVAPGGEAASAVPPAGTPSTAGSWRALLAAWLRRARTLLGQAEALAAPVATAPAAPLSQAPLDVLAAKILFSHMRNRQQMLGPPPTAFGHLDAAQTELLIHAALAAAQAGGTMDETAELRLRGALSSAGLVAADRGFLEEALRRPPALESLLRQVRDPHVGSLFYAASLLTADKHAEAARAWLHFVATRLRLPAETLARLHSQFGAGGHA